MDNHSRTIWDCLSDFAKMVEIATGEGMRIIMSNVRISGVSVSEDHLELAKRKLTETPEFSVMAGKHPVFHKVAQLTVCSGSKNVDSETLLFLNPAAPGKTVKKQQPIYCEAQSNDKVTLATCAYICHNENTVYKYTSKMERKKSLDSGAVKAQIARQEMAPDPRKKKNIPPSEDLLKKIPNTVCKVRRAGTDYECGYVANIVPQVTGNLVRVPNLKLGIPEAVAVKGINSGIVQLHHKKHLTFQIPNCPNEQTVQTIVDLYEMIRDIFESFGSKMELLENSIVQFTDKINTEKRVIPAISAVDAPFYENCDFRSDRVCLKKVGSSANLLEKLRILELYQGNISDIRKLLQGHRQDLWEMDGETISRTVFAPLNSETHNVYFAIRGYIRYFLLVLRDEFRHHRADCLDDQDEFFMQGTRSVFAHLSQYIIDSCMRVFTNICLILSESDKKWAPVNNYEKAATVSLLVFLIMVFEYKNTIPFMEASYPEMLRMFKDMVIGCSAARSKESASAIAKELAMSLRQPPTIASD